MANTYTDGYTDGRERLEFIDAHGAFYLQLDGQPTGMAVLGVYDAALLRGWLVAIPARKPRVPHVYQGEGRWVSTAIDPADSKGRLT